MAYLLPDTNVSRSVRVQLAQADALIARGNEVVLVTTGMPLSWSRSRAEWRLVDSFAELAAADFDFVIACDLESVRAAFEIAGNRSLLLDLGLDPDPLAIPLPKLVVSQDAARLDNGGTFIGQLVDAGFFRYLDPVEHEPLRVLVAGAAQNERNAIDDAYGAVAHARWHGAEFDLVRVSPWVPSNAEPVQELVREFHVAISAGEMTSLFHSCDVFLAADSPSGGLGLASCEALAAGLPCVFARTPALLSLDATDDFARFAPAGDAQALGDALLEVLEDEELRARLRLRAREVAAQFDASLVAERLEEFLEERSAALTRTPEPRE